MFGLGTTELILILVLVLIIFGAGKLPEIGGALGKGIRSFRKSAQERDESAEVTAEPKEEKESVGKEKDQP